MSAKEATARIKTNKLLDALGDNSEKKPRGYIEADQVSANPNSNLIARDWGEDGQLSSEP